MLPQCIVPRSLYSARMWRAEDHTADACLYVEAPAWNQLLEEAVRALAEWGVSYEIPGAVSSEKRLVSVAGAEPTETWVRFWRALHRLWVVEGLLPTKAAVGAASDERVVEAEVRCCSVAELEAERMQDVKAVTWHGAEVGLTDDGHWYGRIVLDI